MQNETELFANLAKNFFCEKDEGGILSVQQPTVPQIPAEFCGTGVYNSPDRDIYYI